MKLLKVSRCLLIIIALFSQAMAYAQTNVEPDPNDPRMTEDDIELEDKFVNAKYKALIGKTDDAIKVLDSIRRSLPTNGTVLLELAKLYNVKREFNLTENNLNAAIVAQPTNLSIREFEASFYKQIGRDEEYVKAINKLIELSPKPNKYYEQLLNFYFTKKDNKSALAAANRWEIASGMTEYIVKQKSAIYEQSGDIEGAVTEMNKLVTKFPTNVQYLRNIVAIYELNSKKEKAIPYLQKILDLQPDDNNAKLALMVYSDKNVKSDGDFIAMLSPMINSKEINIDTKVKELIPLVTKHAQQPDTTLGIDLINICNQLILLHPDDAKAHAIYADVLMNDGKTEAAIIQYEKTLTLNKRNYLVWEQLMKGLDWVGNFDQLDKTTSEAIDLFPNNALSYYYVAKAAAMKKNIKKASEYLEETSLISAKNEWLSSKVMGLKGYLAFAQNNHTEAITLLQQSIDISKQKNGEAYEWLGDVYAARGQSTESKTAFGKALSLGYKSKTLMAKIKG